jgi:hypothetical protein
MSGWGKASYQIRGNAPLFIVALEGDLFFCLPKEL